MVVKFLVAALCLCVLPLMTVQPVAAEMKTTPSGLRYEDHQVGDGPEAVAGKLVTVHYTGWLDEGGSKGRKFDSSVDSGRPFTFPLGAGRVMGWR